MASNPITNSPLSYCDSALALVQYSASNRKQSYISLIYKGHWIQWPASFCHALAFISVAHANAPWLLPLLKGLTSVLLLKKGLYSGVSTRRELDNVCLGVIQPGKHSEGVLQTQTMHKYALYLASIFQQHIWLLQSQWKSNLQPRRC